MVAPAPKTLAADPTAGPEHVDSSARSRGKTYLGQLRGSTAQAAAP